MLLNEQEETYNSPLLKNLNSYVWILFYNMFTLIGLFGCIYFM